MATSRLAGRIMKAIEPARVSWEVAHRTRQGVRFVRAYDVQWTPFVEVEFPIEEFDEFADRRHVAFCGTFIGKVAGREFFADIASDFFSTGQGTVRATFRAWY